MKTLAATTGIWIIAVTPIKEWILRKKYYEKKFGKDWILSTSTGTTVEIR